MPENPELNPFYEGFMKMYRGFLHHVRGYGGCEVYAEKIENWDINRLMTQWMDVAEPMKSGFKVLNHGDMWLNNMMFRSDAEGNPLEVSLIDYQLPFWASPSGELLYFLLSSVADDIKVDYFDDFIEFYHSALVKGLKQLKFDQKIPSLTELHIDLLEKAGFGKYSNI